MIQADLVELIRCPKCRGELQLLDGDKGLECDSCKVIYPIVDDIPQLLIEEARPANP